MTPNLDALCSSVFSFYCVVLSVIIFVFGLRFLLARDYEWSLPDWLELHVFPRIAAWAARHRRSLKLLDRAVLAPALLFGFLKALVFHEWLQIALFGFGFWRCWTRARRERVHVREQRYLEKLEQELHG